MPAVTFVATATAALIVGAVPIFVDIDPRNYTIDPAAVEDAITEKTRCIAPVDYGGMPCDYDALIAIGKKRGIPIVADCAHAHGSQWKGVGVGALTEMGTFSFQAYKQFTTGEGGMVLTNDQELWERAYAFHGLGRRPGGPHYDHHVPASNLRMAEWQAAIGLGQMSRLAEQIQQRVQNSNYLATGLQRLNDQGIGVAPIYRDPRVTRWSFFFWLYRFLPERWEGITRGQFMAAMRAEGFSAELGHTEPLYKNPLFWNWEGRFDRTGFPVRGHLYKGTPLEYRSFHTPQVERIFATEAVRVAHPFFLEPQSEMDAMLEAIEKIWRHRAELPVGARELMAAQ